MQTEKITGEVKEAKAIRDKRYPPCIIVTGKVWVYSNDSDPVLKKADPQGTNPNILLLDLIVQEGEEPMKGVYADIKPFKECGENVQNYTEVSIRYQETLTAVAIDG